MPRLLPEILTLSWCSRRFELDGRSPPITGANRGRSDSLV